MTKLPGDGQDVIDPGPMPLEHIPMPTKITAPVRWYGGKGQVYKKIGPLVPWSKIYCEPYCGAASLYWHLKPREVEVLNDLHSEIINLFRVLQNKEQFLELQHRLTWTAYSLDEFRLALEMETRQEELSPVERAWAFFVRQNQGFAGKAESEGEWGRAFGSCRKMAGTASKWRNKLRILPWWHNRISRCQLDNRDALEVIRYWDSPDTTFYLDPPYVLNTRVRKQAYKHEQPDKHHNELVELLLGIQGQALLSGYDSPVYKPLEDAGWKRWSFKVACCAAGRVRGSNLRGKGGATEHVPRTEVVWRRAHK
jgi:DNA adenine methylase